MMFAFSVMLVVKIVLALQVLVLVMATLLLVEIAVHDWWRHR